MLTGRAEREGTGFNDTRNDNAYYVKLEARGRVVTRERDETDRDTRRNEAKEPPAVGKAGFAAGKAGGGTRPGLGTPR